jgi:hypothetical protein
LAQQLGCAFIETSAKERINVDEAFIGLVGEIKKYQVSVFPKLRLKPCVCEWSALGDLSLELEKVADFSLRHSYAGGQT